MDSERLLRHVGDVAGMPGLFFEAAETERKLPGVVRKRYRVAWPDYAPDVNLAYGYGDAEVRPGPADAAEIFRYDAALELARVLDADDARLVWAVAHCCGAAAAWACLVTGGADRGVAPGRRSSGTSSGPCCRCWFSMKGTR